MHARTYTHTRTHTHTQNTVAPDSNSQDNWPCSFDLESCHITKAFLVGCFCRVHIEPTFFLAYQPRAWKTKIALNLLLQNNNDLFAWNLCCPSVWHYAEYTMGHFEHRNIDNDIHNVEITNKKKFCVQYILGAWLAVIHKYKSTCKQKICQGASSPDSYCLGCKSWKKEIYNLWYYWGKKKITEILNVMPVYMDFFWVLITCINTDWNCVDQSLLCFRYFKNVCPYFKIILSVLSWKCVIYILTTCKT